MGTLNGPTPCGKLSPMRKSYASMVAMRDFIEVDFVIFDALVPFGVNTPIS